MRRIALIATLVVAACGRSPELGTTAAPLLLSPNAYDFGAFEVGTTSPARTFLVSAELGEFDTLTSITAACPDFTITTPLNPLPFDVYREDCGFMRTPSGAPCPFQNARFTVTFTPSFAGPQSCVVTADMAFAGPLTTVISGTGTAPPLGQTVIAPTDGTLGFGDVLVGATSAPLNAIIRNTGQQAFDVMTATVTGPGAAAYTVSESGSNPLPAGEDFQWTVTCQPDTTGSFDATLTLSTGAPSSPVTVALTCGGIQSSLGVSPSPLQFNELLIGESLSVSLTLTNAGSAPLIFGTPTVTGSGFSTTAPNQSSLLPGESTVLNVTFAPLAADAGTDVLGTLTIPFDSDSRTIDLIGPARDAALNLTPAGAIDFGTVCAGQSRSQLFVAVNPGSGATTLSDATVVGEGFALALIAPSALPATLPAHGASAASMQVTATPMVGESTGTMTVTSTIPNTAPTVVNLRATGQASGIGASPSAVGFGGVVVGDASGGQLVRLNNCDAAPLTVDRVAVTGIDAAQFVAVSTGPTLPLTLASGESASFIVELRPTSAGDKVADLEFTHGATSTVVPLTGTGVSDVPGPTDGGVRGSYYACAASGDTTGGVGGVLVIVGALAIGRRRRRR